MHGSCTRPHAGKRTPMISTTTPCLGRVRGFTIILLFCLEGCPRRTIELAELTGKQTVYVYQYLKNMRNYKLVEYDGGFWRLTDLGADFLRYLDLDLDMVKRKIKEREKKDKRKIKVQKSPDQPKISQRSLELRLCESDLTDKEREVVEVLVEHYNKTGSKFMYFNTPYDFAERFKIPPQLASEILKRLKQDRIVYVYRDRQMGAWKIGLYKAFIESLKMFRREGF